MYPKKVPTEYMAFLPAFETGPVPGDARRGRPAGRRCRAPRLCPRPARQPFLPPSHARHGAGSRPCGRRCQLPAAFAVPQATPWRSRTPTPGKDASPPSWTASGCQAGRRKAPWRGRSLRAATRRKTTGRSWWSWTQTTYAERPRACSGPARMRCPLPFRPFPARQLPVPTPPHPMPHSHPTRWPKSPPRGLGGCLVTHSLLLGHVPRGSVSQPRHRWCRGRIILCDGRAPGRGPGAHFALGPPSGRPLE